MSMKKARRIYLGFDTSNYTTSVAAYCEDSDTVIYKKKLLKVKQGEIGLRQNEAVFQHTVALPDLTSELFDELLHYNKEENAPLASGEKLNIAALAASVTPRDESGSYMPCFLVGEGSARILAAAHNVPFYKNSHQTNHLMAALYSAQKLDLIEEKFIAFHVSGGTTEALLVQPDEEKILSIKIIAKTLDLNAGQAIDRVGAALGLDFPAGAALDELAQKSDKNYTLKPCLKGLDCCLSGLENLAANMLKKGESKENVAKFCIDYISQTLFLMSLAIIDEYGSLPMLFSGGVMANSMIKERFTKEFGAYFAQPAFSSDNAVGTAVLAYLKHRGRE